MLIDRRSLLASGALLPLIGLQTRLAHAAEQAAAAMVCDLESVADANSLSGFPLLGVSQSCAVSVAYAVRHRSVYLTWSSMADTQEVGQSGVTATRLIPMKP